MCGLTKTIVPLFGSICGNLQDMSLSGNEEIRYARHLILPQFGREGQELLKKSRVLVVGAGGLGAPVLQYLTAAGTGTIGVVDFDVVDESNLQRQVLFSHSDLGKRKASSAIAKLSTQNPHVSFVEHNMKLDSSNAMEVIRNYDLVVDGTDNFPSRYLINDACVLLDRPFIYGSIFQYEGQVSVFNFDGGPNYRDLFPTPPPPGMVPSCAEGGVLGVLPGIIGSVQALEAIKLLCGMGDLLSGRLFLFDALSFTTRTVRIRKDPDNPLSGSHPTITELIDYEEFCSGPVSQKLKTLSVEQLHDMLETGEEPVFD